MKSNNYLLLVILILLVGCKIDEEISHPGDELDCSHERSFASMTVNGEMAMKVGYWADRSFGMGRYFSVAGFGISLRASGLDETDYDLSIRVNSNIIQIRKYNCSQLSDVRLTIYPPRFKARRVFELECDLPYDIEFLDFDEEEGVLCFTFSGYFREMIFDPDISYYVSDEDGEVIQLENGRFSFK